MLAHNAPALPVAAVVQELADQLAWPTDAGVSCDSRMMLGTGAMQGAQGTPKR